jgi:phage shock protein PspC (stress-responsive transcriptional regulator)
LAVNSIHRAFGSLGLVRDVDDKVLGGVCSGLARRFNVDPWAVRVLVLATLLLLPGSQVIIYPILWVLMPDPATAARLAATSGTLVVVPNAAPTATTTPMGASTATTAPMSAPTATAAPSAPLVGSPVLTKSDPAA